MRNLIPGDYQKNGVNYWRSSDNNSHLGQEMHRVEIIHLNGDSYRMKHRSTIFNKESVTN